MSEVDTLYIFFRSKENAFNNFSWIFIFTLRLQQVQVTDTNDESWLFWSLVGWFVPVMADSSWPHKYDAIDDDLQQEQNNHGEGVLQLILFGQSIKTEVVHWKNPNTLNRSPIWEENGTDSWIPSLNLCFRLILPGPITNDLSEKSEHVVTDTYKFYGNLNKINTDVRVLDVSGVVYLPKAFTTSPGQVHPPS